MSQTKLKRSISLTAITFYGLGTMVGGGIYALIGKVAGEAGMHTPFAFFISSIVAFLTALSYSELSSRYPACAGEATYADRAFHMTWLTKLVGWSVIGMGLVSAATLSNAIAGFVQDFLTVPAPVIIFVSVGLLGGIALWGVTQSVALVVAITLIEIFGLIYVIGVSSSSLTALTERWSELIPFFQETHGTSWVGIFSGAFLAFYAFIGFEDMVNMAEEVERPERNLPVAIMVCVFLTLVLYVLVSLVSVLSVDSQDLASSRTPLAHVLTVHGKPVSSNTLRLISLLAASNGALVQIIMAARVMYGMAQTNKAPAFLKAVSQKTQIPHRATIVAIFLVFVLSVFFNLATLARVTSGVVLIVFVVIHLSLIKLKNKEYIEKTHVSYPILIPVLGSVLCALMLFLEVYRLL